MNRHLRALSLTLSISAALLAARVEETDPSVVFSQGNWTATADTNASGGSYMLSTTAGATVTFQFTGDSLVLYRRLRTDGGLVQVSVDGTPRNTISFLFPETRWQVPAVLDNLGAGAHTVVLTVSAKNLTGPSGAVTVDAFEFPTTFAPSPDQQTALTVVNQIRTQAGNGLPPVTLSAALNLAAQGHASYLATNGAGGHNETQGMPGFIGAALGDRGDYFGYDRLVSEVASPGGDANTAINGLWMATVYHRSPFLKWHHTSIGFGTARVGQNGGATTDFGNLQGKGPVATVMITWPADKQTQVPIAFSAESPNPVPNGTNLGFPVNLEVTQAAGATRPNPVPPSNGSGTLTGPNGAAVPVAYIDRSNDPNNYITGDEYYMVPLKPLTAGTTYIAQITATDTRGNPVNKTWTFTTLSAASFQGSPSVVYNALNRASIQWTAAGPLVTSQLQYGLDGNYGTIAPATTADNTTYVASLTGLAGSTTYHYQVTNTDSAGNTVNSGDRMFTTPVDQPAATIVDPLPFRITATGAFIQWATAGAVASTSLVYGTTTAYGSGPNAGNPNDQTNPLSVVALLTGLTPNTTYHYQITATDAQGKTANSGDQTFMTLAQ